MDNKTPPAWAISAARTIVGFWTMASAFPLSVREQKTAAVISNFSPDAEALAVALESTCTWLENWTLAGKTMTGSNDKIILESLLKEWSSTLASYRARFPKVTP